MRKEVCLYFLRDGKLALQALFFALLGKEALQRVGHAVEGAAQGCELVVARDLDAMREIALVDFYRRVIEIVHGSRDGAVQTHCHDEGNQLKQPEEAGNRDEYILHEAGNLQRSDEQPLIQQ